MANVKAYRTIGGGFTNSKEIVRVIYDFAKDGGAVGTLNLLKSVGKCVVSDFMAVVKTACTSGGSATVEAGATGDTDLFLTATAVASLTADALFAENGAFNSKYKMADGDYLTMTIAVAALTAGKIEFTFELMRL